MRRIRIGFSRKAAQAYSLWVQPQEEIVEAAEAVLRAQEASMMAATFDITTARLRSFRALKNVLIRVLGLKPRLYACSAVRLRQRPPNDSALGIMIACRVP